MNQETALSILMSGKNAFITGQAGAGKTYLLNEFIASARMKGKEVAVTATTGLAATHLDGTTIHSWSGMGIADEVNSDLYKKIRKPRRKTINDADILIIDEISMLHDYRLDMLNAILKKVRRDRRPFGGLQLVMSGDFFQLPPVTRSTDKIQGGFAYGSVGWREADPAICYLNEQHRQGSGDLANILMAIRANDLRRHQAEMLLNRLNQSAPEEQAITKLFTTNRDVDNLNNQQLAKLPGKPHIFNQQATGTEHFVKALNRAILASKVLYLKVGAQVMSLKNSPDGKYVNGSLGEVIDFKYGDPIVRFNNGNVMRMMAQEWTLMDGEEEKATIKQIPLKLAWAMTIHKSQGMTLDGAEIDLGNAFTEGMGYVALSRVKSLDDLYLKGLNKMAITVNDQAIEIDAILREATARLVGE